MKSQKMKQLRTWGGKSTFRYSGSVKEGTMIVFGKSRKAEVKANQYVNLLAHFKGKSVPCGTSRTSPPKNSLGAWLQLHVRKTALASYVGSILVKEGYARKDGSVIRFK